MHKHATRKHQQDRAGFTLVELLVVVSIIMALAAISVAFLPTLDNQQRAADGAVSFQGWLNVAKQRAVRDQVPTGLRLYVGKNGAPNTVVTEAQYIQQPDDFTGGMLTTSANNVNKATVSGADLYGGMGAGVPPGSNSGLWPVQYGDYVEILGSGQVHSITNGGIVQAGANLFTLTLNSIVPYQVNSMPGATNSNYRIIRVPRVVGEEKLEFPVNIGIDLMTNNPAPVPPTPPSPNSGYSNSYTASGVQINSSLAYNADGSIDVLFSPSGNVIGTQAGQNQLIFWIRDYSQQPPPYQAPYQLQGEPTLVVVFTRSGMIAAVQVDPSNGFQPGQVAPPPAPQPAGGPYGTPYTFVLNP